MAGTAAEAAVAPALAPPLGYSTASRSGHLPAVILFSQIGVFFGSRGRRGGAKESVRPKMGDARGETCPFASVISGRLNCYG